MVLLLHALSHNPKNAYRRVFCVLQQKYTLSTVFSLVVVVTGVNQENIIIEVGFMIGALVLVMFRVS